MARWTRTLATTPPMSPTRVPQAARSASSGRLPERYSKSQARRKGRTKTPTTPREGPKTTPQKGPPKPRPSRPVAPGPHQGGHVVQKHGEEGQGPKPKPCSQGKLPEAHEKLVHQGPEEDHQGGGDEGEEGEEDPEDPEGHEEPVGEGVHGTKGSGRRGEKGKRR